MATHIEDGRGDLSRAGEADKRPESPSQIRRTLRTYGIKRKRRADAPLWILALLLVVAVVAAVLAAIRFPKNGELIVGVTAAGVTLAGLLVTMLQWRAGLAEKAFDDLYNRITLANEMWLKYREALASPDAAARKLAGEMHEFFVYTELDSLEYAVRRYRFGLGLNVHILDRAVSHFESCCERDPKFARRVRECLAKPTGYFPGTSGCVERILERVEARKRAGVKTEARGGGAAR